MQRLSFSTLMVIAVLAGPLAAQSPSPNPNDSKYQARGENDRTYTFPGTSEQIPYHIYVPSKWNKNTRLPLVILTHGANQPATAPFVRGNGALAKAAEQRGFITAAVTGYHTNATAVGGWNVPFEMVRHPQPEPAAAGARGARGGAVPAPPTAEDFRRAELDILYVADLMAKEYNADPERIYLMGNSSGGSAVWNVAQKYPERWTAIAPSAAPLFDERYPYERIKNMGVLIVHGDADTTTIYEASKTMVYHAKARGVNTTFLGVPGGSHTEAWTQVLSHIFDYFDKHKTKRR